MGASVADGRTTTKLPATGTPEILEKTTSPLEGTEFLEESFPGTGHKKKKKTRASKRADFDPIGTTITIVVNTFYSHDRCEITPLLGATGGLREKLRGQEARYAHTALPIKDGLFRSGIAGESDTGKCPDQLPPLFTRRN